jgi:L-ascorbate metabolism protein UlaG (beta-lactamase superfamily)
MASTASPAIVADEWAQFRLDKWGRYVNLDGTGPQPLLSVVKWMLRERPERSPAPELPTVRVDPAVATPPHGDGIARLVWLGHASWLVQLAGRSFLIDPVLYQSVGYHWAGVVTHRDGEPPLGPEELPSISRQLVTHNHHDHMDLPSLRAVRAPVIAGLGSNKAVPKELSLTKLGWWETTMEGDVRITFVPSQHWSRRGLLDGNRMLWGGFVIESGGVSIYHSGDTAFDERIFRLIARRFPRLDAALLPIGAYEPEWFMRRQHMTPADALQAFTILGASRVFAMHWGAFKLTDEPLDQPPQRFREQADALGLSSDDARVLAVGESVTVVKRAEPTEAMPLGRP